MAMILAMMMSRLASCCSCCRQLRIRGCLLFVAVSAFAAQAAVHDRPNILWITAEDMSPTLGCYGDFYATTPNIDQFAQRSIRYTHAFATAPVCSPSRSCLITGCYATSLGTAQMRSAFPLPNFIRGFPALLREAGYYTTNNFKTDYNTSSANRLIQESWDESSTRAHWRNRPTTGDQVKPFFSVFNIMTSHQSRSMVWTQDRFRDEVQSQLSASQYHDPDQAPLPPYYPDTTVTRRIVARYYDCVTAMDAQVGEILQQLDEDGLADDTIVFFYSDHGSGLPRHKRLLHDSGMHVPLLVHFPEKWQHLAPLAAGSPTNRLVSFVDFAPTVLRLAGIDPPVYMQGHPFLGDGVDKSAERDFVFGHRDRIDEVIDLSRSVRDKQYLYIRNYLPQLSWNQFSSYSDLSEIRHELYYLAEQGHGAPSQMHYVGPQKPAEEFYDCQSDPNNIHNLADSPDAQLQAKLGELRSALDRHQIQSRDLMFVPESLARKLSENSTPWEALRGSQLDEVKRATGAAHRVEHENEETLVQMLENPSPSVRYWAALGLSGRAGLQAATLQHLQQVLDDDTWAVRIEVANLLARNGRIDLALPVLVQLLSHHDLTVVLHATRTIELLGKEARSAKVAMQQVAERAQKLQASSTQAVFDQSGEKDLAMFCSFSANGFLERLSRSPWIDLLDDKAVDRWQNVTAGVTFDPREKRVAMTSKGQNLWILHPAEFHDFELTAETRMPRDDYNAGIGFRCERLANGRPRGYQCEVAERESGMLYAISSGGWVWPRDPDEREGFFQQVRGAFRTGAWNHFRIECRGARIRIWVNGILATDVTDDRHRSGRIALQHHGKGGVYEYRNLKIRRLGVDPGAE